ncbi:MAG: dockerin type I repeat-containing protein [Candidatus Zixiibacteriota bacterium]
MFNPRKIRIFLTLIFFLILSLSSSVSGQDSLTLNLWIGTASGYPNQQDAIIPIFVENPSDSIAAFLIRIILNRPDMIVFQGTTADLIDTSGTLISGWSYVNANSVSGTGHDIRIVALATLFPGPVVPPIEPQSGNIPLIKIKADVLNVPDTTSDRYALLLIDRRLDAIQFSDPYGQMIGLTYDTLLDTSWFRCNTWQGTTCVSWMQVTGPPADSISIDTSVVPVLDTSVVEVVDGLFVIHQCGDANGNGTINILDGTYILSYLYQQGPPPPALLAGDADGNGSINILDVTFLINYLFKGGSIPLYYR